MNTRQKEILTCLVDYFIDSFQPVSSKMVKNRLAIQLSPASVRQVFSTLDQSGYIEKLHTSSGRVPTEKGFRAYVDEFELPKPLFLNNHVDYETYYDKFRFMFDQFLSRLATKIPYVTILKLHHHELSDLASMQYVSLSSTHGLIILFHRIGVVSKILVSFDFDVSLLPYSNLVQWLQKNFHRGISDDELFHRFSKDEVKFIKDVRQSILNNRSDNHISNNFCVAPIGPVNMSSGSEPTRQVSIIRASGITPNSAAFLLVISNRAPAPSEICEDVPAV